MSKLVNLLSALFIYFCVATVLTAIVGVGVLGLRGFLTRDKLMQITAVMYGVDLAAAHAAAGSTSGATTEPAMSLAEAADQRSIMSMHLALREQALDTGLDNIRGLRDNVETLMRRFNDMREGALKELEVLGTQAVEEGLVKVVRNLVEMEARQAKQQIVFMLEDDKEKGLQNVVSIINSMAADKKAEIYAEFKSENDQELLAEILAKILSGEPQKSHIETTRIRLSEFNPS